jgi:hypothetical protein
MCLSDDRLGEECTMAEIVDGSRRTRLTRVLERTDLLAAGTVRYRPVDVNRARRRA